MQSDLRPINRCRFVIAGLLAMAVAGPAAAAGESPDNPSEQYTWSAELVAVDEAARTVTVQASIVGNASIDWDDLEPGERATLTWSGIQTAAGIRRVVEGAAPAEDRLTLPVEFVSAEHDRRYLRFKVAVPSADVAKLAPLSAGMWITATSPRRAARNEEAVVAMRPYNDVR